MSASSACTAAIGGGVTAVLVGVGVLTSRCYDYLNVTVYDPLGRKTCAATVTASRADSSEHFELTSCYYAALGDGRWRVRATLPGSRDAETSFDVEHADDCTRHVQSADLTLAALGPDPRTQAPVPTLSIAPAPPAPTPAAPMPSPVEPLNTSQPEPTPAADPNALGGATGATNSASAGSTSSGVFPSRPESSP